MKCLADTDQEGCVAARHASCVKLMELRLALMGKNYDVGADGAASQHMHQCVRLHENAAAVPDS